MVETASTADVGNQQSYRRCSGDRAKARIVPPAGILLFFDKRVDVVVGRGKSLQFGSDLGEISFHGNRGGFAGDILFEQIDGYAGNGIFNTIAARGDRNAVYTDFSQFSILGVVQKVSGVVPSETPSHSVAVKSCFGICSGQHQAIICTVKNGGGGNTGVKNLCPPGLSLP